MVYLPGLRSAITAESGHRSTHPAPHHWRLGFDKRDKPHMPRTGESYYREKMTRDSTPLMNNVNHVYHYVKNQLPLSYHIDRDKKQFSVYQVHKGEWHGR